MSIITWIILGLVAGVIANMVDPRPAAGGMLGAIVLGVVGALVGGFIANLVLGLSVTGFNITSVIIAVLGSLLVLWVQRAFMRRT